MGIKNIPHDPSPICFADGGRKAGYNIIPPIRGGGGV